LIFIEYWFQSILAQNKSFLSFPYPSDLKRQAPKLMFVFMIFLEKAIFHYFT